MKIAVCDDDSLAREHISSLINEQFRDAEIACFDKGEDMLNRAKNYGIYFLDVEMDGISGMKAARLIRQE